MATRRIGGMRRRPFLLFFVVVGLLSSLAVPIARAEDTPAVDPVPEPTVSGPVADEVGIKGEPWFDPPFVLEEAQPYPYVSEEFFVEGSARDLLGTGADAAYKTRILVVRPADAADFSGTVVVEWDNVTAQAALNPLFMWDHPYLLREGHAFVSVSAQAVGVCCTPVSHTCWDPARYGDLSHPGDAYSYDIYAQAVEALRRNTVSTDGVAGGIPNAGALTGALGNPLQTPIPGGHPIMGDLAVTNVIATGTSQSASRLHTYLDQIQGIHADNIDGVLLDAGGSRTYTRPPVIPTIHFLSEDGLSATEPNVGGASLMGTDNNYRLWEVPGASHADAEFSRYIEDGLYVHPHPRDPAAAVEAVGRPPLLVPLRRRRTQPPCRLPAARLRRQHLSPPLRRPCRHGPARPLDRRSTTPSPRRRSPAREGQGPATTRSSPPAGGRSWPTQPPRVEYDATGLRCATPTVRSSAASVCRRSTCPSPTTSPPRAVCSATPSASTRSRLPTLYPTTDAYVAQMHAAIDRALAADVMLTRRSRRTAVPAGVRRRPVVPRAQAPRRYPGGRCAPGRHPRGRIAASSSKLSRIVENSFPTGWTRPTPRRRVPRRRPPSSGQRHRTAETTMTA